MLDHMPSVGDRIRISTGEVYRVSGIQGRIVRYNRRIQYTSPWGKVESEDDGFIAWFNDDGSKVWNRNVEILPRE